MRNLKRALSLTLASVMLLGMMIVGTSAASYPDVDDNDNVEAIEVLNAVGVMIGDNGNFKPDAPVTRNEMAVIMAKLILGTYAADSYVGTHPFTDVPSWANRYVAACYASGIVAGRSATTYDGSATVTAVEAAAMMLRALGYEDLSKNAARWDQPVAAKANEINLFKGLNGNGNAAMNRDSVAKLALNALEATMVTTSRSSADIQIGDVTIAGAIQYNDRTTSVYNYTKGDGKYAGVSEDNKLQLCEYLYGTDLTKNTGDEDDFDRPATTWNYDGKDVVSVANKATASYTGKVTWKTVYNDLGRTTAQRMASAGSDRYTVTYKEDGDTASDIKGADLTDLNTKRNSTDKIGADGMVLEIYVDAATKKVEVVMVNTYLVQATANYNANSEELTVNLRHGLGHGKTLANGNKVSNDDVAVSGYKKDDLLLATAVKSGSTLTIKTLTPATIVENVKVNEFKATQEYVIAGGTKYSYNDNYPWDKDSAIDHYNLQKTAYNMILDNYGYVIGVEKYSSEVTLDDILFVKDAKPINWGYEAKVKFMDGTEKTITVASTMAIGASEYKDVTGVETNKGANGSNTMTSEKLATKRFYEFNVKSNGEYELKDIAAARQNVVSASAASSNTKDLIGGELQPLRGKSNTATDTTIFIAKSTVYTGVKNSPSIVESDVYYLLDDDAQNYILAVYADKRGVTTVDASEYVYIFNTNGDGMDDSDNKYYVYSAIKDGAKVDDFKANDDGKGTGLYKIESYENGYPVLGTACTGEANVLTYKASAANTAIKQKDGVITDGTNSFHMASDGVIYVVDSDKKNVNTIGVADVDSLETGNYAVYAIQVSTSNKDISALWLVKAATPAAHSITITSGTVAAVSGTTGTYTVTSKNGATSVTEGSNATLVVTGAIDSANNTIGETVTVAYKVGSTSKTAKVIFANGETSKEITVTSVNGAVEVTGVTVAKNLGTSITGGKDSIAAASGTTGAYTLAIVANDNSTSGAAWVTPNGTVKLTVTGTADATSTNGETVTITYTVSGGAAQTKTVDFTGATSTSEYVTIENVSGTFVVTNFTVARK